MNKRLFIDPNILLQIVPYWTAEEAEECAKMACAIIKERVRYGSDLAYDAAYFRAGAYEGIIRAKRRYEQNGEKLQVRQCRGYIRSYTAKEVQKKSRTTKLDVLDSGKKNLVYDCDKEAMEEAGGENEELNLKNTQEELESYIKRFHYNLLSFAKAFLSGQYSNAELKAKFGSRYGKLKKEFEAVSKAYAKSIGN
jgi:hypothetical protein